MRFLVTGATGFIGSNLALYLEAQGEVTALCNSSPGSKENLAGFKGRFVQGDIRDFPYETLGKFDAVFHQAAISDTTVLDPKLMFSVNVQAFQTILNHALKSGCRKVVYASSAATYGKGTVPMKESDPPTPANIYGESKVEMESVAKKFCAEHPQMSVVGLRYFNVYGLRETHKIKAASMIYQLYSQIAEGKSPRLFKWGEQFRDFIYVKDVLKANQKALEFSSSGVFNVGTGLPTSFNKVVGILNPLLGAKRPTEYFDNPWSFYQSQTQAETSHAEKVLGFRADFTPEEGIKDYVNVLRNSKGATLKV